MQTRIACKSFDNLYIDEECQSNDSATQSPNRMSTSTPPENEQGKIDPAKYKTKICRNYANGLPCPFEGRCVFPHGEVQLRAADQPESPVRITPPVYSVAVQENCPPPPPYSPPSYNATMNSPIHALPPPPPMFAPPMYHGYHSSSTPMMHNSNSMMSLGASSSESSNTSTPRKTSSYPRMYRHDPYSEGINYVEIVA